MRNKIIALMQDLYYDGARARALLIEIGCRPAQIPEFRAAETFWPEVVIRLETGIVVDGIRLLVAVAARDHPGNEQASALLAEIRGPAKSVRVLCFFADPLRGSKIRIDREARLLMSLPRWAALPCRLAMPSGLMTSSNQFSMRSRAYCISPGTAPRTAARLRR